LLNQFFPAASEEVTGYLEKIRSKYSLEEILAYLDRMKPMKVLAVGEAIIDEYRYVQAIGKSSKEPTLAVKHLSTEKFAGGILACANTVAEFSDNVGLITLVGDNDQEDAFIETELKSTIVHHLIKRADSPTIKKTRFVESNNLSKLFEVYTISDDELCAEDDDALCRKLEQMVPHYDMVVLVDFGHHMLTQRAVGIICDQARFLCVNAQSNAGNLGYQSITKFRRADYVCMTENEARLESRSRSGNLKVIVEKLARQMGCKSMVVTRGKAGSLAHSTADGFSSAPSLGGRVVDRVGAGDAFLTVTGMAALLGAPTDILEFIGNAVGALAVGTVGHREPISKVKLTKFITSLLK
jgi:bifunctional ADP-heptose synthase (sugar kinase/adenylyltransferase)